MHILSLAKLRQIDGQQPLLVRRLYLCTRLDQHARRAHLIRLRLRSIRSIPMHRPEERRRAEFRTSRFDLRAACEQQLNCSRSTHPRCPVQCACAKDRRGFQLRALCDQDSRNAFRAQRHRADQRCLLAPIAIDLRAVRDQQFSEWACVRSVSHP